MWVHIIFSTKNRKPFLTNLEIRKQLHDYLFAICDQYSCPALIVGGVEDHVHLLISLHKNLSLSSIIEKIKKYSSKWIKSSVPEFYWQSGYGAFSVSKTNIEKVKSYIQNQQEHHRKVNFQDELRKILDSSGIKYDEKYVWG